MDLEDLRIYDLSMQVADRIWRVASKWDYFEKRTVGSQLVRSADSIGANISEGYGRYHFKDAKNFYYYARGSLFETKTWLKKAQQRNLLSQSEYDELKKELDSLSLKLNKFINAVGKKN